MKKWIFAAVVAVVAALVVPVSAAAAATAYTWVGGWTSAGDAVPGADHQSWGDARNWQPQGVPNKGDSVLVTNVPARNGMLAGTGLVIPDDVSVTHLTIQQVSVPDVVALKGGGSVTVTGSLTWTGGDINIPLRIPAGASGQISAGPLKNLRATMTVDGTLALANIGNDKDHRLLLHPISGANNDRIVITRTGKLTATGTNLVAGFECCGDPARVINKGTMTVKSGTTTFSAIEFDQLRTVSVAKKARLINTVGPVRLGAGARYAGGGTLEFTSSAKLVTYPTKASVPGGILMQGKGTLAGRTRLLFGAGALLTGVGSFVGKGTVDFSAAKNNGNGGALIYGSVKTGPKVTARFAGAEPAQLAVYVAGLKGYHGVLRIAGKATVAKKKSVVVSAGTKTTIAAGARLVLKPGSSVAGDSCCKSMAKLTIARGAVLAVPKASQAKATVLRAKLVMKGTTKPARGNLVVTR